MCVQAVVEEAGVADVHTVQTDVKLRLDAAPQVVAAAGELNKVKRSVRTIRRVRIIQICLVFKNKITRCSVL